MASSQQSTSLEIHQSAPSSMPNDVSAYSSSVPRSTQMLTSDSLSTSASEQNATGSSSQYGSGVSRTAASASSAHAQLTTVAGILHYYNQKCIRIDFGKKSNIKFILTLIEFNGLIFNNETETKNIFFLHKYNNFF